MDGSPQCGCVSTLPPYGTSMPQSGCRPPHQKRKSSISAFVVRFTPESRHSSVPLDCPLSGTHAVQQMKTLFGFAVGTVVLIWKVTKTPIRQVVRVQGLD